MDNSLEELLSKENEALKSEVAFLKREIRRKDNDWTKAWRRMQRLFNDRQAEVLKLEDLVERLAGAKKVKELNYG